MKRLGQQSGFLSLMAVMIILIFGLLGSGLIYLFISQSTASGYLQAAIKAEALADTGLETGQELLSAPTIPRVNPSPVAGRRQACLTLNSLVNTLDSGEVTVSSTGAANYPQNVSLDGAINNTVTTLSVFNGSNLATRGRIYIGREAIDYQQRSGNTLSFLTRGADNTFATGHADGTTVSQLQCMVNAVASSPDNTNPLGQKHLRQAHQLPLVVAVGNNATHSQWVNPPQENWFTGPAGLPDPYANTQNFYGVDLLNAHEGWSVGLRINAANYRINRFINGEWRAANFNNNPNGRDLYSVTAVSSEEAWAAGRRRSNTRFTILRWRRSTNSWCLLTTVNNGSANSCGNKYARRSGDTSGRLRLYAIKAIDYTGDGFADFGIAGGGANGNGTILEYDGSGWINNTSAPLNNIGRRYGVDIVRNGGSAPIQAFVVGRAQSSNTGSILRYTSGNWTNEASVSGGGILRGVSVIDTTGNGLANFGFAVGNGGTVWQFNGSSWTNVSAGFPGTPTLNSVVVINPNDAWVVANGGRRYHWDGSSWTLSLDAGPTLRSVAAAAVKAQPQSAWHEVVN